MWEKLKEARVLFLLLLFLSKHKVLVCGMASGRLDTLLYSLILIEILAPYPVVGRTRVGLLPYFPVAR